MCQNKKDVACSFYFTLIFFTLIGFQKAGGGLLHEAIDKNETTIEGIEKILNDGASVNERDQNGYTPLHLAIGAGRVNIVELLLSSGADVNKPVKGKEASQEDGDTPLYYAVMNGKKDVVVALLKNEKADVNISSSDGTTPLHEAASSGKIEIVKLLLKHKADITKKDNGGKTPLDKARDAGKGEIVTLLSQEIQTQATQAQVQTQAKVDVLFDKAVKDGNNKDNVEKLLTGNPPANINNQDDKGQTPLHHAVERNKPSIVELLLKHKANTNLADNKGKTALDHAIEKMKGRMPVLKVLLKDNTVKVDVNKTYGNRDQKQTPLHIAAMNGDVEIVQLLLKKGFTVEKKDMAGKTPLRYAVQYGKRDIVTLLLASGADINTVGDDRLSLLHIAVGKSDLDTIKILRERGIKVVVPDDYVLTHVLKNDQRDAVTKALREDIVQQQAPEVADNDQGRRGPGLVHNGQGNTTIFTPKNAVISASVIGILSFLLYQAVKKRTDSSELTVQEKERDALAINEVL